MTSYRRLLGETVTTLDTPFGYTLTIWSSGTIAVTHYGPPSLLNVLLLLVGAIIAYLIVAAISDRPSAAEQSRAAYPMRLPILNVISVAAAFSVAILSHSVLNPELGFAATGFIATGLYATLFALLRFVAERTGSHTR